ncbi:MAG: hypothetical protein QOF76_5612 [Solirubrobacteraceae bacterium]|jgi:hypothetical protein|nr:hypothetical protein [Solirubrobacteraceae bacterium]
MRNRSAPIAIGGIAAAIILGASAGGSPPATYKTVAKKHHRGHKPKRTHLATSKDLWATINVCDVPPDYDNTIGIRGSMPGLGNRSSRLVMRFQVQFKSKTDGEWHNAGPDSDSGWQRVGRTVRQVIESGQNFTYMPPTDGGTHLLRGRVRFRWYRHNHVVARQERFTEAGHRSTAGAQPDGYSAAQCEITAP